MSLQVINLGAAPNDMTGDSVRVGGQKINANFKYLDEKSAAYRVGEIYSGPVTRIYDNKLYILNAALTFPYTSIGFVSELAAGKWSLVNKNASISNTNTYSSAPTTANQVLSILEIPANTFANNDIINFKALFSKETYFSNYSITVWKNTSLTLIGAEFFYKLNTSIPAYTRVALFDHKIAIIKSNNLILSNHKGGNLVYANYETLDYNLNNTTTQIPFNPAVINYLIVTCELVNANDVVKQEAILIEKIN